MKKIKWIRCILIVICIALAGCGHEHSWKEANCLSPKTCQECDETEGTELGHDWQEATCTKPKTCARCGATEGEALGHEWREANCTEAKTCAVCGTTEGVALGHDWQDATCTEAKTCAHCGITEGEALGHDAPNVSCVKDDTCTRCGEVIPALGHEWQEATCTEPGICARCGKTKGEPKGHTPADPVKENEKKPSCTKKGRYEEVVYCSVCKHEISREEKTVKALGHEVSEGVCTRCGEKIKVILYEDSNVNISFKKAERSPYSDDRVELYFYVENKTEKTLLIQADAVSINGYCFCDLIMSDPVNASATGVVNLSVSNFDFDLVDISNIKSVGGQFRIIDDSTWKSYDALFTNTKLDGTGNGSAPKDFSNQNLLYEDNSCAIYYRSIEEYEYSDDRAELYLYLHNKTKKTLLIQADAVTLNGYSFSSLIMSDPVLPKTIGIINTSINEIDFDDVDISELSKLGGQFRIIDDATWKSYKASFKNVEIG